MLFIGGNIIFSNDIYIYSIFENMQAHRVLQLFADSKEFDEFIHNNKNRKYKLLITTKKELIEFLEFFKSCPLTKNETITIKRYGINLKETFETIQKYEEYGFTNKIYVEQLDKNEWVNYEDFKTIYAFLKKFDNLLPENPSELDIITNAYDYVKKNPYVREKDDKSLLSKLFSLSVLTGYRVCAGFTKQFNAILKEYGIQCYEYMYAQKDKENHMVSLVNIKGHGVYFFDLTRDCFVKSDQIETLKNESKYSGFMLAITDFNKDNIIIDNYDKEIFSSLKALKLKEKNACQKVTPNYDDDFDITEIVDENFMEKLNVLIDTNFELFKDETFFDGILDSVEIIKAKIYSSLQTIQKNFGNEITDDFFIETLINAKRNTILKNNTRFYQKAVISKFVENESINLSDSMVKVNKKLK